MSTEHDDAETTGLVSLSEMVYRTAEHRYGPEWRGPLKVETTLGPGVELTVTVLTPPKLSISVGTKDVEERIRAAADAGDLLIHFPDGQRPPQWYWRSDPGRESISRGYFVARHSGALLDYDGKELFAGEINFARWLAGVPKHEFDLQVAAAPPTDASANDRKRRRQLPEEISRLRNRIENVFAVARRVYEKQESCPEYAVMAAELAKPQYQLGYSEGTLRQIFNGTYRPAKRLALGRFEPKKPNRPSR